MLDQYLIQMSGDEIVENSITEKLQSLVAICQSVGVKGGVGECLEKVRLVTPHVADHVLELVKTIQEIVEMSFS